jgi:hypothetical protein
MLSPSGPCTVSGEPGSRLPDLSLVGPVAGHQASRPESVLPRTPGQAYSGTAGATALAIRAAT